MPKFKFTTLGLILFLSTIGFAQDNVTYFFPQADKFFNKYVKEGLVDYRAIKNYPVELNSLVLEIERFDLTALPSREAKKAFWINAYNILVIYSVIQNYPINSPQDVGGFFDRKKHNIAGEALTLNELEHERLFREFNDPRLHFVLVCAAMGCPRIIKTAYYPDRLNELLDRRTRITMNDPFFVKVDDGDEQIQITELFRWYRDDFAAKSGSVTQFINQYRKKKIPANYSPSIITYDWSLNEYGSPISGPYGLANLQAYTPSTLLKIDEVEIKFFNNLYTQTAFFDDNGDKVDENRRSNFFTGIVNFLYGLDAPFNIGFDLYFRSVFIDPASGSTFNIFKFQGGPNARTAIAQIAPKVKFAPFRWLPSLAIQTSLLFPTANDLEGSEIGEPFLEREGMQWWTQLFYDLPLGSKFLLYLESDFFYRWHNEVNELRTPFKAILNFYPSTKWTVYLPTEYTPTWDGGSVSSYFIQVGLGLKYQLFQSLELETLYTTFPIGKNGGAGQTYNFGIRYIR